MRWWAGRKTHLDQQDFFPLVPLFTVLLKLWGVLFLPESHQSSFFFFFPRNEDDWSESMGRPEAQTAWVPSLCGQEDVCLLLS